jgi:asparagine synthase (glutamine-hydrolysing)
MPLTPKVIIRVVADYGLGWTVQRGWLALLDRLHVAEHIHPCGSWRDEPLKGRLRPGVPESLDAFAAHWREKGFHGFLPAHNVREYSEVLERLGGAELRESVIGDAERVLRGEVCFYSDRWCNVGFSPAWIPLDWKWCASLHWSRVPTLPEGRDIKDVWELSRFAFAWTLVRAFAATGDERYPEHFWRMVESWRAANPPNTGPNWACGQEAALRLIAWVFALHAFRDSPSTTPGRLAKMVEMIDLQARRITVTLAYSRLQKNNHSISEGAGLYVAGVAFPELAGSDGWRRLGRRILERDALRLIAPDGSFSQHSVNYHRLMLHDYLFALRMADVAGESFHPDVMDRIHAAGGFLHMLTDSVSGLAPNMGGNDGARILPLDGCAYGDMRPACAAARMLSVAGRLYADGPWNEPLYWLYGKAALDAPLAAEPPPELRAHCGGVYTLRGEHGWAMFRCGSFRMRPAHADSLHVDLWWKGRNLGMDAGSYRYNAPAPWDGGLAGTAFHNTVELAGRDQLVRGPRFMWLNWHRTRLTASGGRDDFGYLEGEHEGYLRLATPSLHRRALLQVPDGWLVVDEISGRGMQEGVLRWLLPELPLVEQMGEALLFDLGGGEILSVSFLLEQAGADFAPVEPCIIRPQEAGRFGWVSRLYGRKDPALCLALPFRAIQPLRMVTRLRIYRNPASRLPTDSLRYSLQPAGITPMLLSASFEGRSFAVEP